MQPHKIVSRAEWIEARRAHMAHEKEYRVRLRDQYQPAAVLASCCHN